MKIFFYKYGSICEPDISGSFRRLGFEVVDEDMEIYNKNLLPSQCVEAVSKKLMSGQFTFVFTINFFPWLSDLCEIMHLKYLSLIVDSPVLELYSYSLKNDCKIRNNKVCKRYFIYWLHLSGKMSFQPGKIK